LDSSGNILADGVSIVFDRLRVVNKFLDLKVLYAGVIGVVTFGDIEREGVLFGVATFGIAVDFDSTSTVISGDQPSQNVIHTADATISRRSTSSVSVTTGVSKGCGKT
jgi:hypothetical protein